MHFSLDNLEILLGYGLVLVPLAGKEIGNTELATGLRKYKIRKATTYSPYIYHTLIHTYK